MGKLIDFARNPDTLRIESQPLNLTEAELVACDIAKALREAYTDEEVADIAAELEAEVDHES